MPSPAPKQAYLSQVESPNNSAIPEAKAITIAEKYRWITGTLVASSDLLLLVFVTFCIELVSTSSSLKETSILLLINILSATIISSKIRYYDLKQGRHSIGKASVIGLSLWFTTLFIIALSRVLTFESSMLILTTFMVTATISGIIHHKFHWQGHYSSPEDPYYQIEFAIKRFTDIAIATCGLLMVSPLLAIVSLLLWLENFSSPIFKQTRVGYREKFFPMFKFRSMRVDTEYQPTRKSDVLFKQEDDPRITPLGKIIRKFSIDEVPQLVNVIRGEMSLIGPRPVLVSEYEAMNWYHKRKFEVIPGMTGLWQITGRIQNKRDFLSVANYDVGYIESWCLVEDLKILIKTIPVVVFQRGAC